MNISIPSIRPGKWLFLAVCCITLVALSILFVSSPLGQEMIGGGGASFGPALQQPQAKIQMIEVEIARVSFEEAQQVIPFHIPHPTWLPAGVTLQGAHVQPPNWVNVFYGHTPPQLGVATGGIGFQVHRGDSVGTSQIIGTEGEEIRIGDIPAVMEWVPGGDTGSIKWAVADFHYQASTSGLGLRREDLIRFAESIE